VRAVVEPLTETRRHPRLRGDPRQFLAYPVGGKQYCAEPVGEGSAQRRLAGAGQAADDGEPDCAVLQLAQREIEVGAGVCGGVRLALVVAQ